MGINSRQNGLAPAYGGKELDQSFHKKDSMGFNGMPGAVVYAERAKDFSPDFIPFLNSSFVSNFKSCG